jgi:hypothetical protein
MEKSIANKMKEKITMSLPRRKNVKNAWEEVYKLALVSKKGLLPKLVYKYIQLKVKETLIYIVKDSARLDKRFEDYASYVISK